MEATYTPLYDNAIFHVLCYLDNNIFGSIIYTYKNFIPLNTRTYIGDYCTILYSYIDFFEIDMYVLYKNNYCVEIPNSHKQLIGILYKDVYPTNIMFSYTNIHINNLQNTTFTLFHNHLFPLLFLTLLFSTVFLFMYKITLFKPLVVFFRKVIWETEQNLVSLEDFFIILAFYLAYILHFGSIFIPIMKVALFFFKFTKCLIFCFSAIVSFLPIYFIWQTGVFIFYYIKGSSNDNNVFVAALNDTMGLLSTLLRYLVQAIRWFLFFLFYFLLQLFLYEIKYILIFTDSYANGYQSNFGVFGGFDTNILVYVIYVVARILFEILDFVFVAVVQLSAFLVVLFWLLGFLFSNTIPSIFEFFYQEYRNLYKKSLVR